MFQSNTIVDGVQRSFARPKFLQMAGTVQAPDFTAAMTQIALIRTQENIMMHWLCITYSWFFAPSDGGDHAFAVILNNPSTTANVPFGSFADGANLVNGNPNVLFHKDILPGATGIIGAALTDSVVLDLRQGLLPSGQPIGIYAKGVANRNVTLSVSCVLCYNSEKESISGKPFPGY